MGITILFSNLSLLIFLILPTTSLPPPPPPPPPDNPPTPPPVRNGLKPGIAATIAIIIVLISIIFLLLLYAKHCNTSAVPGPSSSRNRPPSRRPSGVDWNVIDSLPMFRFASLRGHKTGLECAVCLGRFEPDEILRLLPKCKHAFHVDCIDQWLDRHNTCPLCRYRVDPEDLLLLEGPVRACSRPEPNPRVSARNSSSSSQLEIIVENSTEDSHHICRQPVHRVEHRIVISGGGDGDWEDEQEGGGRRWSDAQAAEVLYLRMEMILENVSGKDVINGRSMSEMAGVRRRRNEEDDGSKKGVVQRWLDWMAESKSQREKENRPRPTVNSASPSSNVV